MGKRKHISLASAVKICETQSFDLADVITLVLHNEERENTKIRNKKQSHWVNTEALVMLYENTVLENISLF